MRGVRIGRSNDRFGFQEKEGGKEPGSMRTDGERCEERSDLSSERQEDAGGFSSPRSEGGEHEKAC